MGKTFINNLRDGSIKSPSGVYMSNGSEFIFAHSMDGLPEPISKQTGGQWETVHISPIYGWPPVWISTWRGGYPSVAWVPVEYIDALNRVTIGNSAFNFYQKETCRFNGLETDLTWFFAGLGVATATSWVTGALAAEISTAGATIIGVALVLESAALSVWVSDISQAFSSLYTSTYVEVLNGMHGSNAGSSYM